MSDRMMERRELAELIDTGDPAWPIIRERFAAASNRGEVLPVERERGERALLHLQVTNRSPLGAVALMTGGILFDRGWLRFFGAGGSRMQGSLLTWSGQGDGAITDPQRGILIVAHDAVGGFFALNGGGLPGQQGIVHYWAPDSLEWEAMGWPYSDLLQWAATGDLKGYYGNARWPGWQRVMQRVHPDQGLSFYPPLWVLGPRVGKRSKRLAPMTELWTLQQDIARQLAGSGAAESSGGC